MNIIKMWNCLSNAAPIDEFLIIRAHKSHCNDCSLSRMYKCQPNAKADGKVPLKHLSPPQRSLISVREYAVCSRVTNSLEGHSFYKKYMRLVSFQQNLVRG